jgi:hypothetical protein
MIYLRLIYYFKPGKSYVVFGKKDNTAINLSDIAAGIGGFVINGESARDYSGCSVSSAGDVNGDGLDDLIVARTDSPLITKPPLPATMSDNSMAPVLSFLPNNYRC